MQTMVMTRTMIDKYHNRNKQIVEIQKMDSWHLINAHNYFRKVRAGYAEKDTPAEKILSISLLIAAIREEIDKRGLLDF
jgi:hypothetical protein